MFQLKLLGVILIGAAGIWAYQKVDHGMNYLPVTASVNAMESTCYMRKVDRGVLTKTTTTTDTLSCAEAERMHAEHPAYRDMKVEGTITVDFDYVSPADKHTHSGKLTYGYEDYKALLNQQYGGTVPILAHKSVPEKVAHDYGAMTVTPAEQPAQ